MQRVVVTRQPPGDAIERVRDVADVWVWPENRAIPPDVLAERIVDAHGLYAMLTDSIDDVNRLMLDADRAIEDLASGQSKNIHQTMIAMQKADISFRMLMEVRTKIIRAYEEVIRTQV